MKFKIKLKKTTYSNIAYQGKNQHIKKLKTILMHISTFPLNSQQLR